MNSAQSVLVGGMKPVAMIDWITARIMLERPLPRHINGGEFVRIDELGNIEQASPRRKRVSGSHESSINIRAASVYEIEITGNLVKFVQGHNLYGSSDPAAILWAALTKIEAIDGALPCSLAQIGLTGPDSLLQRTFLSRMDCTVMLLARDLAEVREFLRSLRTNGRLRDRGQSGLPHAWEKGEGATFGGGPKRVARHRSMTFYSKGLDAIAHPLPDLMMADDDVMEWVKSCLRCEVRLGSNYLRKRDLRLLANWSPDTALAEWNEMMARIDMNASDEKPAALDDLPAHLQVAYSAWLGGADLRSMFARRTYYRKRADILKATGVDIAIPRSKEPTAQIVPIKRVIELRPAGRPSWADRIDQALRQSA